MDVEKEGDKWRLSRVSGLVKLIENGVTESGVVQNVRIYVVETGLVGNLRKEKWKLNWWEQDQFDVEEEDLTTCSAIL